MALFLITDDLDGARYLWKRLPTTIKNSSQSSAAATTEMTALWKVGKSLHEEDMNKFQQLINNRSWSSFSTPFIKDINDAVRIRVLRKVEKAYSVISTTTLCQIMGLSNDEEARLGKCVLQ